MNQDTITPNNIARASKRYKDAYRVAKAITAIGGSVKGVGAVLGLIVAVLGFYIGMKGEGNTQYAVGGILAGIVVALPLYLLGVVVSAQGQVLKATLDGSVNTSPFLDLTQKAQVMSLE